MRTSTSLANAPATPRHKQAIDSSTWCAVVREPFEEIVSDVNHATMLGESRIVPMATKSTDLGHLGGRPEKTDLTKSRRTNAQATTGKRMATWILKTVRF